MKRPMKRPTWGVRTEWCPIDSLPTTPKGISEIAVDLETRDPRLRSEGPGWATGKGDVAGIAVAYEGFNAYLPFGHEGGGNLDRGIVCQWFEKEIAKHPADKIFHNASYDVGWLRRIGIEVDTMLAAPLVDENRASYSLNSLAYDYSGEAKSEATLREAAAEFGVDAKAEMYKLPACFVGEYAEADARLTLDLWQILKAELTLQDLWSIFELETKVFPICLDMTWKGIRVDLDESERVKQGMASDVQAILQSIKSETGHDVEIWAAASIAALFDDLGLTYGRTVKTDQPSFTKDFLTKHDHPIARQIGQARDYDKIGNTFLNSILRYGTKGRIHGHINQLRGQSGGTVSGRLSMAHPNLQQIPSRNPDTAKKIRGLFLPEEGCEWASIDFDQQEPRILVHWAASTKRKMGGLPGSAEFVKAYVDNPETDFHRKVAEICSIPRPQAKTINLGLMYGMGITRMSEQLDIDVPEAKRLMAQYHEEVPFVSALQEAVERRVQSPHSDGCVRTLLGRRCRFNLWEPRAFVVSRPLSEADAHREYGESIQRAFVYRALNRLIQASAADQTKAAMVAVWEACGEIPLVQIHDELAFSVESKEQAQEICKIMEGAVDLLVPTPADISLGPNWGALEKVENA